MGPVPQRIPIITYPKFEADCNSLLKKHLTREIWANMKKKTTTKGGNIQLCVKSGVSQPKECSIGVMATDDEAFKVFGDLFGPIIKDLHPRFDYRFSYQYESLNCDLIDNHIHEIRASVDKVVDFKISIARNFKDTPFAPLMTRESKL